MLYLRIFLLNALFHLFYIAVSGSPLSSGEWYKMPIKKDGVYKISYLDLKNLGVNVSGIPKIYCGYASELPTLVYDSVDVSFSEVAIQYYLGNDNVFNEGDFIVFYAEDEKSNYYDAENDFYIKRNHPIDDHNNYYLTFSSSLPLQINTKNLAEKQNYAVTSYISSYLYEKDVVNLFDTGKSWCEYMPISGENIQLQNYLSNTQVRALIRYSSKVQVGSNSQIIFEINGTQVNAVKPSYVSGGASAESSKIEKDRFSFLPASSSLSFSTYLSGSASSSACYLDYVIFNAQSALNYSGSQIEFSNSHIKSEVGTYCFKIYSNKNIHIYNVTNLKSVYEINCLKEGNDYYFTPESRNQKYIVFSDADLYSVESASEIENQGLSDISNVEMIIVAHPDFHEQALRLKELHETYDDIRSVIVTQDQIFTEYSSGKVDVSALRNFFKEIKEKGNTLKYVLLFGDGLYDNRPIARGNTNNIITYQSVNSESEDFSFVSDDFFGLLENGEGVDEIGQFQGLLDLGIGRLTVNDEDEARIVVDKITHYVTNTDTRGDWRNYVTFLADDSDGDENSTYPQTYHMTDSDILVNLLEKKYPSINSRKIYADSYKQYVTAGHESYPDVVAEVKRAVNRGTLVLNYKGHGRDIQMGHEKFVGIDMIEQWDNKDMMPLVVTASCEITPYDKGGESLGEKIFLKEHGGAIALLSTTRIVYSTANQRISENLYSHIFDVGKDNRPLPLGEIVRLAKVNTVGDYRYNKRSFALIGDPALRLAVPTYKVVTDTIIGAPVVDSFYSMSALSFVTVKGHVENAKYEQIDNYNGIITATVFDKKSKITTLGNDGYAKLDFSVFDKIIFRGNASVSNGAFSFSFYVPKDVSYSEGVGRISYYADDLHMDAQGYFDSLFVGATEVGELNDDDGPVVNLYMNDTTFKDGGVTNGKPTLLARIFDSSGINVTGNAIGHDAVAYLDDHPEPIVLNDFFETDIDKYTAGFIRYQFFDLEEGNHFLKVKVWDVNNNSSEASLNFLVAYAENVIIEDLMNYPNPFINETSFTCRHNQAGEDLTLVLKIYDSNGRMVEKIQEDVYADSYSLEPITFDANDKLNLKAGVYFYTLSIANDKGGEQMKSNRMLYVKPNN